MSKEKEQKRFISNLEKDIKRLENEINNEEQTNKKRKTIKNLKISKKILTASSPYVLAAGIITGFFTWNNLTPFVKDETYMNPFQKKEIDNKGNIYYEEQLKEYSNNNELYYYGKWQKTDKDFYSRDVKVYRIGKNAIEKVNELLEDENFDKNINLEDILGEPLSTKKERKNNLSEEEIKEDEFIKAIYYDQNKDEFVYHKETTAENFLFTVMWIIITTGSQLLTTHVRKRLGFNFNKDIDKINEKYKPIDTKKLIKQLEIKKENLNLLTEEEDK